MASGVGDGDGGDQNGLNSLLTALGDYYSGRREEKAVANIYDDKRIFPDFRSGPLEEYRERASFCYKRMNVVLEGEDHIRLKVRYHFQFVTYVHGQRGRSADCLDSFCRSCRPPTARSNRRPFLICTLE